MSAKASLRFAWLALAVASIGPSAAAAAEGPAADECYDALVSARIVRQIPTEMPDCGQNCIVMSWPWFLDLRVERVLEGGARRGNLTVLSVQHSDYRTDLGVRSWWLRRNSEGGFNALRPVADVDRLVRCPPGTPPALAYLRPGHRTLADVRREAERHYRD